MNIPTLDETRLDALRPDMQFAVYRHDEVHTGLESAFREGDVEGAMGLLDELCKVIDTTSLRFVFSETNLHREVIATASLISTSLATDKRMKAGLKEIIDSRGKILEELDKRVVKDAVFIGSTAASGL
jgi:hypothetical protein